MTPPADVHVKTDPMIFVEWWCRLSPKPLSLPSSEPSVVANLFGVMDEALLGVRRSKHVINGCVVGAFVTFLPSSRRISVYLESPPTFVFFSYLEKDLFIRPN